MGEEKSNSDKKKRHVKKTQKYNPKTQNETQNEGNPVKQSSADTSTTTKKIDVATLADEAVNINVLRYEVDRLPLDFKARAYFENDVRPLIDTLYTLSLASLDYSTSAKNVASINFGRSSKIKDALELTDEINGISDDLIKVLKCKVDNMLKLSKYDCKCK
ncbi:hypothetical protein [Clostridium sp.]|uniref:hypothetical protein n=1 Tax=Clostridium sp. TaxID=1506 RepID=UPI001A3C9E3E|nr:hypothetical protein [Clostridium sp.]MBK5234249.1 hypothetical protein [Clostridium sp.]